MIGSRTNKKLPCGSQTSSDLEGFLLKIPGFQAGVLKFEVIPRDGSPIFLTEIYGDGEDKQLIVNFGNTLVPLEESSEGNQLSLGIKSPGIPFDIKVSVVGDTAVGLDRLVCLRLPVTGDPVDDIKEFVEESPLLTAEN